jgi:hypothetical protein
MRKWLILLLAILLMALYAQLESDEFEDRVEAADQLFRP